MTLVAALWLALLHALCVAAPVRSPDHAATSARPRAVQVDAAAGRIAARAERAPEQSLRLAPGIATGAIARAAGPGTGSAPIPALLAPAWPRLTEPSTLQAALRRRGGASHAVATRGRLLPYFPTAPPRQG